MLQSQEKRLSFWLPWLATPALLLVIAALQFYLVGDQNLSPWKGGGFGMFSTVDSPSARLLRSYLLTPEGEVQVQVPPHLDRLSEQARSMPTKEHIRALAEQLAAATWVDQDYDTFLHRQPQRSAERSADGAPAAPTQTAEAPRLRALGPEEAPPGTEMVADVAGVRVEIWRYSFDSDTSQLAASKDIETTLRRR